MNILPNEKYSKKNKNKNSRLRGKRKTKHKITTKTYTRMQMSETKMCPTQLCTIFLSFPYIWRFPKVPYFYTISEYALHENARYRYFRKEPKTGAAQTKSPLTWTSSTKHLLKRIKAPVAILIKVISRKIQRKAYKMY